MTRLVKGIGLGVLGTIVLLVAMALIVILTGAYDVAADEPHAPVTEWALDTTMRNSVQSRAAGPDEPAVFTPDMVVAGAGEYKAMRQQCHGGIGVSRDEWTAGMMPHRRPGARGAGMIARGGLLAYQAWREGIGHAGLRGHA